MKNLLFLLCLGLGLQLCAQQSKTIKKNLAFSNASADNTLIVENINGSIEVEAYNGSNIQVELDLEIDAKSERLIEKGFQEIQLGVLEKEDIIVLYMDNPCSEDRSLATREQLLKGHSFNWSKNCQWDAKYYFNLDYKIKVPRKLNVRLSTVNQGEIKLSGVQGTIQVNNVNGGIHLQDIAGKTKAHTVNGNVVISYQKNPTLDCDYYTLNGNIELLYQKGFSADAYFESMHGEFSSNIDELELLPQRLEPTKTKSEKGIKYKIGGAKNLRIRSGGPLMRFETLNGDVIVKERKGS